MKARIIATGEIIDVVCQGPCDGFDKHTVIWTDGKRTYYQEQLDFSEKDIDWEQRRYELAKDVLSGLEVNSESKIESDCKLAIDIADELIKQLKESEATKWTKKKEDAIRLAN